MFRASLPAAALLIALCLPLSGCGLGYYWQAASGHMALMGQRRPIAEVAADADTPEAVREQLRVASAAVEFARDELGLPDGGSYRHYADTGRDAVVWNVFAAPALGLEPRRWCYPVAGCVSYRGYFAEADARDFARRVAASGDDVFVGGVAAYSTLGRFDDPVLNTMIALPPPLLAGLLFHELAHQRLYLAGDTDFNEAFASVVEREGIVRWTEARGDLAGRCAYRQWLARRNATLDVLRLARARLDAAYASGEPDAARLAAKARILDETRAAYQALRASWAGPPYFDAWFGPDLNNALLAAIGAYEARVPAFRALLAENGGDLEAFYARAEALAALPETERNAALDALAGSAAVNGAHPDPACATPGPAAAVRALRPD